ncbi:transmembrane adaptor Erv26 [Tricharina praecox]|uniref:transmembrane adaptor Erv26 n=1 Tax=Tricharina praecox TaxID=43433 RepID=UPI00222001A6|nr:transmembrane adaptor Erv26 [Tricharina praecox]KAI5857876.1 transmembrane adaptor Erv26 [Tricharina praecox]
MWIFPLIGYVGVIVGFSFLTLAIASGLYYLSELVEEHTVISKKLLTGLIQCIIAIHILLMLFDGFPKLLSIFSAASHGVYLANVTKSFPMVRFTDPVFMLSCCLVIANHFLWFKYFSHPQLASDHPYSAAYRTGGLSGSPYDYSNTADPYFPDRFPTFTEISAFFGICVWMVPFALFVSLSASDNVLPSSEIPSGSVGSGGFGGMGTQKKNKGPGIAKMVFNSVRDYTTTSGEALGLWGGAARHERFE